MKPYILYKTVRRGWLERLFSLTPWRTHKQVRDWEGEIEEVLDGQRREHRESTHPPRPAFLPHKEEITPESLVREEVLRLMEEAKKK